MLADAGRMAAISISKGHKRSVAVDGPKVGEFCHVALTSLLDGYVGVPDGCFVQGFCAALDAFVSCTIDFDQPVATVRQAWHDVMNDGAKQPAITSVMDYMTISGGL